MISHILHKKIKMHFSSQNISCNKRHSIYTTTAIVINFLLLENFKYFILIEKNFLLLENKVDLVFTHFLPPIIL